MLGSAAPWRALAYLLTSCVLGVLVMAAIGFALVFFVLLPITPLAATRLAALERRRLALLGRPVPPSPHRQPRQPGLAAWLRLRYAEPATWRAFAYAVLLATVVLVVDLAAVAAVAAPAYAAFIWPFFDGRWVASIGFVALLIIGLILATLLATAQATLVSGLLGGQIEQQVQDLTRSRARLVDVFEAQRRQIERDLHDGAQQRLVGLSVTLGWAAYELQSGPQAARDLVTKAGEQAQAALRELRELVRGIHPQVLTDHGLPAAITELADRSAVPATVEFALARRLPSTVESTAYFVVAEALTNVAKHAGAAQIAISGRLSGSRLVVEVSDDGLGGADPAGGAGLAGLAERVAAIDGVLTLSSPLGGPTVVHLELPCSAS
ncbi:histidine kinase [Rhizocola hellebori]|uniref:histidine kinase n=1 Tax=Rhizocola hellebori TaxID=1392758 RepID=A0A8J3QG84_9ACTN|nr:histidine kinase [Rhizocola hellebori]